MCIYCTLYCTLQVCEYEPELGAELGLEVGDRLLLLREFGDGWMAGAVLGGASKLGLFPARCVRRL